MSERVLAAVNAVFFFLFWLLVLLAGADRPPQGRFLWVALLAALCSAIVYWRVSTYIHWSQTKKPGRLPRAALEGLAAGLVVAIPFAQQGSGEPSTTTRPIDHAGWFVVLGFVGLCNSLALYGINALLAKRLNAGDAREEKTGQGPHSSWLRPFSANWQSSRWRASFLS